MRKIKFRIYDKKLKEFHYLDLEDLWGDDYWYDGETPVFDVLYDCNNSQERFVIQQYTGLYDAHKTEIYEGDIVKVEFPVFPEMVALGYNKEFTMIYKIVWDIKNLSPLCKLIGFFFEGDKRGHESNEEYPPLPLPDEKHIEVIGNIYEDPELLEQNKIEMS